MEQVAEGTSPYHFIEVMGCPGGCITGGGQPRSQDPLVREKRLKGLYAEDELKELRKSRENPDVSVLYKEFLQVPNSLVSHEYLHTHYTPRGLFNERAGEALDGGNQQTAPQGHRNTRQRMEDRQTPALKPQADVESARVLALEAENMRLKGELTDALETVDIFKQVVSNYNTR